MYGLRDRAIGDIAQINWIETKRIWRWL